MTAVSQAALDYVRAGLSVIPIRPDGSKSPIGKWLHFQSERPNESAVVHMFGGECGIGILGGGVSQNLEILDFDAPGIFDEWQRLVEQFEPGLAATLPVVSTPSGGHHVYFRSSTAERNQKLARSAVKQEHKSGDVLIETRGEGGYVIAPPSPPSCHPSGGIYEHIAGPPLTQIPAISEKQRSVLIQVARSFNEREDRSSEPPKHIDPVAGRPGDDFNARAHWQDILGPHGWEVISQSGNVTRWRRPGKDVPGISATTGAIGDNLYVFSTNAEPFESERKYSKFSAYALLNYSGDWSAAAAQLAKQGYGSQPAGNQLQQVREQAKAKAEEIAHSAAERLGMAESFDQWLNYTSPPCIPTGIRELDKAIRGGIPTEQVTTIGGYTGVGKSEVARHIRTHAAREGFAVVHVDVELGHRRIMERELAQRSGLPVSVLRKRQEMTDAQWADLMSAKEDIECLPIRYLGRVHGLSLDELELLILAELEHAKRIATQDAALVVLDSAHRLSAGAQGTDVRLQVRNFMYWAERLAKVHQVAVLCTSEHKRSSEGSRPTADEVLTAGAETRAIEFQSDCVLGLVQAETASDETAGDPDAVKHRRVSLIVAKVRDGDTGYLKDDLVFVKPCWEMQQWAREDQLSEAILDALGGQPLSGHELEKEVRGRATAIRAKLKELQIMGRVEYLEVARKWRIPA